jgi:hypothetical protein
VRADDKISSIKAANITEDRGAQQELAEGSRVARRYGNRFSPQARWAA